MTEGVPITAVARAAMAACTIRADQTGDTAADITAKT